MAGLAPTSHLFWITWRRCLFRSFSFHEYHLHTALSRVRFAWSIQFQEPHQSSTAYNLASWSLALSVPRPIWLASAFSIASTSHQYSQSIFRLYKSYSALSLVFPIATHRNSIFVFLARLAHQGWNSGVSRTTFIGHPSESANSTQRDPRLPRLSEMHRPMSSHFGSFPWSSFESDLTCHLGLLRSQWTAWCWDLVGQVGGVAGGRGCTSTFRSLCGPSNGQ